MNKFEHSPCLTICDKYIMEIGNYTFVWFQRYLTYIQLREYQYRHVALAIVKYKNSSSKYIGLTYQRLNNHICNSLIFLSVSNSRNKSLDMRAELINKTFPITLTLIAILNWLQR